MYLSWRFILLIGKYIHFPFSNHPLYDWCVTSCPTLMCPCACVEQCNGEAGDAFFSSAISVGFTATRYSVKFPLYLALVVSVIDVWCLVFSVGISHSVDWLIFLYVLTSQSSDLWHNLALPTILVIWFRRHGLFFSIYIWHCHSDWTVPNRNFSCSHRVFHL